MGVDLNLNYLYQEKYAFKIGLTGNVRKPKSKPEDFTTGIIREVFLLRLSDPVDLFESYQISIGRIYQLSQDKNIRLNLSVGAGYTIIREPGNWEKRDAGIIPIIENYTYDYTKSKKVSLIINPKIEFPISKFFGLTISPMAQINKGNSYFGIGIGTMIGSLK